VSIVSDVMAELEDLGALGATDESPELVEALDAQPPPQVVVPPPRPTPTVDPNVLAAKVDSGITILENLLEVFTDIRKALPSTTAALQVSVSVPAPSVPEAPAAPATVNAEGVPEISAEVREQALAKALAKIRGEDVSADTQVAEDREDNVPFVGQERIRPVNPGEIQNARGQGS
jgi:hypothetical protein